MRADENHASTSSCAFYRTTSSIIIFCTWSIMIACFLQQCSPLCLQIYHSFRQHFRKYSSLGSSISLHITLNSIELFTQCSICALDDVWILLSTPILVIGCLHGCITSFASVLLSWDFHFINLFTPCYNAYQECSITSMLFVIRTFLHPPKTLAH